MVEYRWEEEMQEAMELVYRLQADHGGRLPKSEAMEELGDWVADAVERAEHKARLTSKGSSG